METKIKYVPLGLFCVSVLKVLIVGATYVDAPVLLILACLAAVYETKSQLKVIKALEDKVAELQNQINDGSKSISEIKTFVGGIKLGQNIRTTQVGGR